MGTPLYMSPEQNEGRELDSRSDIYSLGCTVYHMLAGKPPFTGDTPLSVAVQHLNQPPPPLVDGRPGIPPRLAQVVERMMAKKPGDRFTDPGALLYELHALTAEGAEQGWAARPDYTSLAEMLQAADQRSAATTRLDELMKNTAIARAKRVSFGWLAAALLACVLVGVAIAALVRPTSLLAGAQNGPPKLNDVWRQLYHAKLVDTEDGWLAVDEYFPEASVYCRYLAKQGLAYYYLHSHKYEQAIKPLEELEAQSDFKPFGISGQVVVYANLGDDEKANKANARLNIEMRKSLEKQSPQMFELLNKTLDEVFERAI
jgi:serine/threonine-protein kinase